MRWKDAPTEYLPRANDVLIQEKLEAPTRAYQMDINDVRPEPTDDGRIKVKHRPPQIHRTDDGYPTRIDAQAVISEGYWLTEDILLLGIKVFGYCGGEYVHYYELVDGVFERRTLRYKHIKDHVRNLFRIREHGVSRAHLCLLHDDETSFEIWKRACRQYMHSELLVKLRQETSIVKRTRDTFGCHYYAVGQLWNEEAALHSPSDDVLQHQYQAGNDALSVAGMFVRRGSASLHLGGMQVPST